MTRALSRVSKQASLLSITTRASDGVRLKHIGMVAKPVPSTFWFWFRRGTSCCATCKHDTARIAFTVIGASEAPSTTVWHDIHGSHFIRAKILVLVGGAILPATVVPASTRITARLKRVGNTFYPRILWLDYSTLVLPVPTPSPPGVHAARLYPT